MSASTDALPPGSTVGVDPLVADTPARLEDAEIPDAATRLAASRERLRLAMTGPPPEERLSRAARQGAARARAAVAGAWSGAHLGDSARSLFARLRALPAADVLLDAVQVWWAGHPLHTAGAMAADASKAYVQPIARRNPVAFVVGSAVVGALFFLTRPWRWALRPVLLAGLLPQIVSHALRRAPLASWMHVVQAFAQRRPPTPRRPAPPAASAAAQPPVPPRRPPGTPPA